MGSSDKTTILDRLLEMVRGRGGVGNPRPEKSSRKAEGHQPKIPRKAGKKRKKAARAA